MAAAEEYLRDVGGTDAFSESVYEFLKKEDELPSEAGNKDQKSRESTHDASFRREEQEGSNLEASEGANSGAKSHRVSAPMGALLGLAEQLENMLKEEGAKGWDSKTSERPSLEGASSQHGMSEFRDVGVDPNARNSSGSEWRSSGSQDGRRSESSWHCPHRLAD